MTLEQILILAVLVLAPLLNILVRLLRRHLSDRAPREPGPEAAETLETRTPVRTASSLAARRGEVGGLSPSPAPPLLTAARRRHRRPRVRIASAAAMRRGIVLMAVLRPGRGLEPPGLLRGGRQSA